MESARKTIVIVDPRSSGEEFAPLFKERGVRCIAIQLSSTSTKKEQGGTINPQWFDEIILEDQDLLEKIRALDPMAVIAGTENGVFLAQELSEKLNLRYRNEPPQGFLPTHKFQVQELLEKSNLPFLKSFCTKDVSEAETWLHQQGDSFAEFIIKPPISAGSSWVLHCRRDGDWKSDFKNVLESVSFITGKKNEDVVLQELARGQEYAIGTVSVDGEHFLSHILRYQKIDFNQRQTVYDYVELIPYDETEFLDIWTYVKNILTETGVRWGASHTEVISTAQGPRLIETSPRMCGGPVQKFSMLASASNQAMKTVEMILEGCVKEPIYQVRTKVRPVFLRAMNSGTLKNVEIFEEAKKLKTFQQMHLWYQNGNIVPATIDYLTNFGIIALAGPDQDVQSDYLKIRALENQLLISSVSEVN